MTDHSQLRQLGLFDARVPRYTSYPTAPVFGPAVRGPEFQSWLGAVPDGSEISLYIHVPFCRRLCWFCACRTQGTATGQPVADYVETVLTELDAARKALPPHIRLSRLHWGGGTPTMMTAAQITRLAGRVAEALPFADDAEFSVEIDPNEIDDARLDALAAAGMNRASIGVQDFDPLIQKAIGRDQSFEVTAEAVAGLRARGIGSLNVDLLYGLPYQTLSRIRQGVGQVLTLRPDRVALYGYAHVPWMARRQAMIPAEALPGPEERLALAAEAERLFRDAGYLPVGIDHYALPDDGLARAAAQGRLRRNFQGYTDDTSPVLVGLGASSISRFPQGYAQNAAATGHYQKTIRAGEFATERGHALTPDDRLRGRIIESLMCSFSADLAAIAHETGVDPAQAIALIDGLQDKFPDFVHIDGGLLTIPPQGRLLARMIARHFDAHASRPAGGFSQAT